MLDCKGPRALLLGALLAIVPATAAHAQGDGKVPDAVAKDWLKYKQTFDRLYKTDLAPYLSIFKGHGVEIPKAEVARPQLVKLEELEKGVIAEAKALNAKFEQEYGENDRNWLSAWKKKWGVTKRIRGWEETVVDLPKGPDGKDLDISWVHRQMVEMLDKVAKWRDYVVGHYLKQYEGSTKFEPKKERVVYVDALDAEGRWKRAVGVEESIPEAEAWAKVHPGFAEFPAALKKKAEQMQKEYDEILAEWKIPEDKIITEESWEGEDYEEVLDAIYEKYPKAQTVLLSQGWKVSDRNILERPIQYRVEAYVVLPTHEKIDVQAKDASVAMWTYLYTDKTPDAKREPPFKSTGSTSYYLIANDNVPDSTRPGGFFGTLLKLALYGGCCLIFLGAIGGGGYFAYTQVQGQKAAGAAPAVPTAPPGPQVGGAPQAGIPPEGLPPAVPPTTGQIPAPPQPGQPGTAGDPNQPPPPQQG